MQIDDAPIKKIIGDNENQLNDDEVKKLEGELTYEELTLAPMNMKHLRSPGNDGFTAVFFNFFDTFRSICFKIRKLCIQAWFITCDTK